MTKQITTSLTIAQLVRWDMNPRPQATAEKRSTLKASIQHKGVITPLIVRPFGKQFQVIAGDTRRDIITELAAAGEWDARRDIVCIVRPDLEDDDAAALDVALSENIHIPMNAMDQFTAFQGLIDRGRTVTEIANAYGVKPRIVEQRLSFAKLDSRARDLVTADLRDLDWASAMTMASLPEQKQILDEIEQDPRRYVSVHDIRRRLQDELAPISLALFDPKLADSKLVRRNLFDIDTPSYLPIGEFNRLQDEAVTALAEDRRGQGWKKVSIVNERDFDRYQYNDGIDEPALGEVIFVRCSTGEVQEHKGLQLRAEVRVNSVDSEGDEEAGISIFEQSAEKIRAVTRKDPTYAEGKATIQYLEKNRALIAQAIMMGDRKLTFAVLAATLITDGSPKILEGRVFNDMLDIDPEGITRPAVERRLDAQRQHIASVGVDAIASFEDNIVRLMEADEDSLMAILATQVASRITTNMPRIDVLYDALLGATGTPVSTVWRPDRAYLSTLSKDQLLGLARRILPNRFTDKMDKQKQSDLVETVYQIVLDAYEGGMRLENSDRDIVTAFAPAIIAGSAAMSADVDNPFAAENEEPDAAVITASTGDAVNDDDQGSKLFGEAA